MGLKAQFIVLACGIFGVIVGIYQIAFQTESLSSLQFMLVFTGGGVVLTILSLCSIFSSQNSKNPPPEYPLWSEI